VVVVEAANRWLFERCRRAVLVLKDDVTRSSSVHRMRHSSIPHGASWRRRGGGDDEVRQSGTTWPTNRGTAVATVGSQRGAHATSTARRSNDVSYFTNDGATNSTDFAMASGWWPRGSGDTAILARSHESSRRVSALACAATTSSSPRLGRFRFFSHSTRARERCPRRHRVSVRSRSNI